MRNILLTNKFYTKEIETITKAHLDDLEIKKRRGEVGQLWGNHESQYYKPKENDSNVSSQAGKTGISRAAKDNPTSEITRVHCTNVHAGNKADKYLKQQHKGKQIRTKLYNNVNKTHETISNNRAKCATKQAD